MDKTIRKDKVKRTVDQFDECFIVPLGHDPKTCCCLFCVWNREHRRLIAQTKKNKNG